MTEVPTNEQINELKAYVEGVLHGKVIMEQMGPCKRCGTYEDLRFGLCFDCVFPACPLNNCGFKRLVYYGHGRKQKWTNLQYIGRYGKVYCDREEGLCAKARILEEKK